MVIAVRARSRVELQSQETFEAARGCSPHEAGKESNPVEVETEIVRHSKRENSEGLGFVLAVHWIAELWYSIILEGVGDLLLTGVLALEDPSCLCGVSRVVSKVCHGVRQPIKFRGGLLGHSL